MSEPPTQTPNCPICENPQGDELSEAVVAGKLTVYELSRAMGIGYDVAWKHIREHLTSTAVGSPAAESSLSTEMSTEEMIQTLSYVVSRLRSKVDVYLATAGNAENDRTAASLIKELRGLITDIATLEGKLQKLPLEKLESLTKALDKINAFMVTELCDSCKLKLAEKIAKDDQAQVVSIQP